MWPFTRKTIPAPSADLKDQIRGIIQKSLTYPQAAPDWKLYSHHQKDWSTLTAINEGYNASAIVYAAIEKRAKCIASVPAKAMKRKYDGTWEHMPLSRLQMLLDNPNPDMSWQDLIYHASQSLDLSGNAFLSEIRGGVESLPAQLWLLPSAYIRIKPGRESLIDYYEYVEARTRRIDDRDMVQIRMPNPDSMYFGMPPLKAAGRPTDIDREAGIWQKVSLQNRGASDVNIKLPDTATQEQVTAARESYKAMQAGPANARKAMISNAEITMVGQTAVEMDFVNSRKAVWTEIAAVFGTPLATLGFTDDVNLANAETMRKLMWQDTIIPQLDLIYRQLTHQLAREFGNNWMIVPDLANVAALQEGIATKLDSATKLFAMGVPFNQINAALELGFDNQPGGNIGYLNAGLLPVGFEPEPVDEGDKSMAMLSKLLAYGGGDVNNGS
jgi:HK97 family phage portal protein